jgi:hypothetical protein
LSEPTEGLERIEVSQFRLLKEIVATYLKHDWNLRRVLLTSQLRDEINSAAEFDASVLIVVESEFDGLWFSRPSHGGREAWELRLVAETPYALFEAFESDESEEDREEVRIEMEAKMREYLFKPPD